MRTRYFCLFLLLPLFILTLTGCEPIPSVPEPTEPIAGTADAAPVVETAKLASELEWSLEIAQQLVALPLSCIDRPHKQSQRRSYLYETTRSLKPRYEDTLAFYGCTDWHSAVNSTWAMVRVLKDFPDAPLGGLIREKLEHHLSSKSLEGELGFFREEASPGFERPYGWAWLMRLYVELASFRDDDAERWATHLAPVAAHLAEKSVEYLSHMPGPIRVGTHENSAFALLSMLEYADVVGDANLKTAVATRAHEFFEDDVECPVRYEPSGSDFLSPCLAEAALMGRLLPQEAFVAWLDDFLPPPDSESFSPMREPVVIEARALPVEVDIEEPVEAEPASPGPTAETEVVDSDREDATRLVGAKSHLIGLSFVRAAALKRLAAALPPGDRRRAAYTSFARLQGKRGFETMYEADYSGTHWLASFAVDMLTAP